MAGNSKRREAAAALRLVWDDFLAELREGKSLKVACQAVGLASDSGLYYLLKQDSTLAEQIASARRDGAHALMSQTLDIADETAEFALVDPLRSAEQRIKVRQHLAARLNREDYGDQGKGVNVSVNIAGLHLDALRRQAPRAIEADVIEGEILQALPAPVTLDDIL
jgi:hypothetical protein